MKRFIIFIISVLIFSALFSVTLYAQTEEEYKNSIEILDIDGLQKSIDESAKKFLKENDIDINDFGFVNNLNTENIFLHIFSVFKNGLKEQSALFCTLLGIIFISASSSALNVNGKNQKALDVISSVSAALLISNGIWSLISTSVQTVKAATVFMTAFIPVFAGATFLSGGTISSASTSAVMLLATSFVSYVFSYLVLPLLGIYLAITLCSSISAFDYIKGLTDSIKKALIFVLSLSSTVYVGILGIKTNINASADSLGLKTAKFIVGTFVPVAGGSLAEAANTVYSSMSFIRSSLGVYAIIILVATVLPFIAEILLWKGMLGICNTVSSMFNQDSINTLFNSIQGVLSVLNTVILFTFGLFIISLGVVISAGHIQ